MSQVPKIYNIPIREPMFINGIMSQAWITFFETLSKTANITYEADPIALAQKQQNLQSQIAFGVLVGAVGLQSLVGDGDVMASVAIAPSDDDGLPSVAVGQVDGFCGLPVVAVPITI